MASPDKVDAVDEMREKFSTSNGAVVTAYTGLTVAQLKELRRSLGENAQYRVVKNTLTKIAANEAGINQIDDLFTGSSAVAFVTGDPVEAAKGLRDFAKDNPALVIKGGVLDGKALSADDIKKLADLESREVLLSKLAGAMKGKQSQAAALFQAPLSKFIRTAEALRAKVDEQGGAGEPAPAEAEAAE
ncbi:50S ribosomal protein L10 [Streptomyces sp. NPDC021212]|uniref:50S ribosomal protein L10 n=1 Tax=Streptomyces sp. NPDC021212 TaxID=3365118 RepID=UPI00378B5968